MTATEALMLSLQDRTIFEIDVKEGDCVHMHMLVIPKSASCSYCHANLTAVTNSRQVLSHAYGIPKALCETDTKEEPTKFVDFVLFHEFILTSSNCYNHTGNVVHGRMRKVFVVCRRISFGMDSVTSTHTRTFTHRDMYARTHPPSHRWTSSTLLRHNSFT